MSNRPVCGYVTAGCCGCQYKCIASNGKSVMYCILTYAVVKVYGKCLFHEHQCKDYAIPYIAVFFGNESPSMSELQ